LDLRGHFEARKREGKEGRGNERKEKDVRKHPLNKFIYLCLNHAATDVSGTSRNNAILQCIVTTYDRYDTI